MLLQNFKDTASHNSVLNFLNVLPFTKLWRNLFQMKKNGMRVLSIKVIRFITYSFQGYQTIRFGSIYATDWLIVYSQKMSVQ